MSMRRSYPSSSAGHGEPGDYWVRSVYICVWHFVCVCVCVALTGNGMSSSQTHEMLEQENDQLVESLGRKVAALKSVSWWSLVCLLCSIYGALSANNWYGWWSEISEHISRQYGENKGTTFHMLVSYSVHLEHTHRIMNLIQLVVYCRVVWSDWKPWPVPVTIAGCATWLCS